MKTIKILVILVLAFALAVCSVQLAKATPMGTAFTYQGLLYDVNDAADGLYDFAFKLYDANTGGSQQAGTIDVNDLDVTDGQFTVQLDFGGGVFDGNAIWLETTVAQSDGSDPCTLSPRQELTPTPYALYATSGPGIAVPLELSGSDLGAIIKGINTALNGEGVYGKNVSSGNYGYLGTNTCGVKGVSDDGYGVRGSSTNGNGVYGDSKEGYGVHGASNNSYAGYFEGDTRITGDLIVDSNVGIGTSSPGDKLDVDGHINSSESYKLDGDTVLSNAGIANYFVGKGAGESITAGANNTAAGNQALKKNTEGQENLAMGHTALRLNTTGSYNSAMGSYALRNGRVVNYNTAVGYGALEDANSHYNTAVGAEAGNTNSTGSGNVFLGYQAGYHETDSDKLYIANSDTATPLIYGDFSAERVGIMTNSPQGTLDVNGPIYQRGGQIHADYVFESDYQLESIEEHSKLMWQNKHLPAIPKAKVDENGQEIVEVGAHRRGILEELEKAHIYIEQLHNRIKVLEEKLIQP